MIDVWREVHLPTREGVNRRPVVNAWPGALLSLPQIDQEGTALSAQLCVYPHYSFPPNKHYLFHSCVSVWKIISTQLAGQGLATGP